MKIVKDLLISVLCLSIMLSPTSGFIPRLQASTTLVLPVHWKNPSELAWWQELALLASSHDPAQHSSADLELAGLSIFSDYLEYLNEVGMLTAMAEMALRVHKVEDVTTNLPNQMFCSSHELEQWQIFANEALDSSLDNFIDVYCGMTCINSTTTISTPLESQSCEEKAIALYEAYHCDDSVIPDDPHAYPSAGVNPSFNWSVEMPSWEANPGIPMQPSQPRPTPYEFGGLPSETLPVHAGHNFNVGFGDNPLNQPHFFQPDLETRLSPTINPLLPNVFDRVEKKQKRCQEASERRQRIIWDPNSPGGGPSLNKDVPAFRNPFVITPIHPDLKLQLEVESNGKLNGDEIAANCKLIQDVGDQADLVKKLKNTYSHIRFLSIAEHFGHLPIWEEDDVVHEITIGSQKYSHSYQLWIVEAILASSDAFFFPLIESIDAYSPAVACAKESGIFTRIQGNSSGPYVFKEVNNDDFNSDSGVHFDFEIRIVVPKSDPESTEEGSSDKAEEKPFTLSNLFDRFASGFADGLTFGAEKTGMDLPRLPYEYNDFFDGTMSEDRLDELRTYLSQVSPEDLLKLEQVMRGGDSIDFVEFTAELIGGAFLGAGIGAAIGAGSAVIRKVGQETPQFFSATLPAVSNKIRAHIIAHATPGSLASQVAKCFVAGTLIHTAAGLKPIEDIEVGDLVLSRDDQSGNMAWKPVVQLFHNRDKIIIDLTIVDEYGKQETLGVTEEHPFWHIEHGWVEAQSLQAGDRLLGVDDSRSLKVFGIAYRDGLHETFNFEVADYHTYFVSQLGIWVHNTCGLSVNQLNQLILRGTAPKGIIRIDSPKIPGEKVHAHFSNGAALNRDGTWKHGSINLTSAQRKWLRQNGWNI